jgi:hypothetical protein
LTLLSAITKDRQKVWFPATAPKSLLGILNAHRKIRKRMDTDLAVNPKVF